MTPDEIEAALQIAFQRCDTACCPLTDTQKNILLQVVKKFQGIDQSCVLNNTNPLSEMNPEELSAFLSFVKFQEENNLSWKVQLLNDWLHGNNSGEVQFLRDRYGVQWLNRIEAHHFDEYSYEDVLKLKVGSHIEICNALWEWVQENSPCEPEWFPCIVIQIESNENDNHSFASCTVRLNDGSEYEIQGVYDWNRYNWRWGVGSGEW